jgi:hypothetical protein
MTFRRALLIGASIEALAIAALIAAVLFRR